MGTGFAQSESQVWAAVTGVVPSPEPVVFANRNPLPMLVSMLRPAEAVRGLARGRGLRRDLADCVGRRR